MKVLIRDKSLNLYLASGDQWVADANKGWDFQVGVAATDYARAHGLTDIELVYSFRNPGHNFSLPLEALKSSRAGRSFASLAKARSPRRDGTSKDLIESGRQM
jgi:hypothetical protein